MITPKLAPWSQRRANNGITRLANSFATPQSPYSDVEMSKRSVAELRAKAAEYRRMVETARVLKTRAAVIKIADRYDVLADKRD